MRTLNRLQLLPEPSVELNVSKGTILIFTSPDQGYSVVCSKAIFPAVVSTAAVPEA